MSHRSGRAAALEAALAELQQWGVDRFSIEGAAQRAHMSPEFFRQTWGSERQLIIDALLDFTRKVTQTPDTGSLRGDLTELAYSIADYLNDPVGRRIARMMVVDSKSYEVDLETRGDFWGLRKETFNGLLLRAAARGELREDVKPTAVAHLLSSPLHFVALYSEEQVTQNYCRTIADLVARALIPA